MEEDDSLDCIPSPPRQSEDMHYISLIENVMSNPVNWLILHYNLDWIVKQPIDITEAKVEFDFAKKKTHKLLYPSYVGNSMCMVKVPLNLEPNLIYINSEDESKFFIYSNTMEHESNELKTVVFEFNPTHYKLISNENDI